MSQNVNVPELAWYGDTELELKFPPAWDIHTCYMKGHSRPVLSVKQIRDVFKQPKGIPTIKELAKGKKEVAIIFDDMTRPTPVAQLVPYVLEELKQAGIPDSGIRFISGLGCHGAITHNDFRKKLGKAAEQYPIYNHNPYENCTFVGTTSRGTPVSINGEVASCDLKIGIGCIVPHPMTGFGGGGKIILPAVSSIETIVANHGNLLNKAKESGQLSKIGLGLFDDNIIRQDIDEAAKIAGLNVVIDAVVNLKREIIGLFVGDITSVHDEGVKFAKEVYATESVPGADIVIANTYSKANEATLAVPVGSKLIGKQGGDLVLIANTPEGQVTHYLMRTFGKNISGQLCRPLVHLYRGVNRLIVLTPYIDRAGADWIGPAESIIWCKTWDEVMGYLKADYPEKAKVIVVPDATVQYFPS